MSQVENLRITPEDGQHLTVNITFGDNANVVIQPERRGFVASLSSLIMGTVQFVRQFFTPAKGP